MSAITQRALLARINRRLSRDLEAVRKCPTRSRHFHELGEFYHVDANRNCVLCPDVDLVGFARELRVISAWEALAVRNGSVQ